jgi:quercetin dioxygenase-like cupin family protein
VSDAPITDLKIVDNVFVKLHYFINPGDTHQGHAHVFDHITLLATGAVRMVHDNGEQEFEAPHLIVTPKGVTHQFIALKPGTLFCCIHAIRDGSAVDDIADPAISVEQARNLLTNNPLTVADSV